MRFKNLLLTLVGLSSLSLSILCSAAELSVEQDVLLRLQQLSENQQLQLQDREQSLIEFESKLLNAQTDLTQAKNELQRKEQELAEAIAGGEALARQRKLAEHAVSMAKRSVKNRLKRTQRIEGKLVQEKAVLAKARNQLLQSRSSIAQQEAKLARLRDKRKAEKVRLAQLKSQRAAPVTVAASKPRSVAKKAVANDKAISKPKTVQTSAKVEPAGQTLKISEQKPITSPSVATPSVTSPPVTNQTKAGAKEGVKEGVKEGAKEGAKENLDAQRQLAQLDELARSQAAAEERRLAKALAAPKRSGNQRYSDLRIKSDTVDAGFEFLGNHQYRAETAIDGGRHMFSVGSHHYRGTIPNSDDGEVYVFLFDTSRKGKPRLSMYRKSLLN